MLYANGESRAFLDSFGDDLRFVFITSNARVADGSHPGAVPTMLPDVTLRVSPSAYQKCGRCWHYRADVGANQEHPALCGRCISNLFGTGEPRVHA